MAVSRTMDISVTKMTRTRAHAGGRRCSRRMLMLMGRMKWIIRSSKLVGLLVIILLWLQQGSQQAKTIWARSSACLVLVRLLHGKLTHAGGPTGEVITRN